MKFEPKLRICENTRTLSEPRPPQETINEKGPAECAKRLNKGWEDITFPEKKGWGDDHILKVRVGTIKMC